MIKLIIIMKAENYIIVSRSRIPYTRYWIGHGWSQHQDNAKSYNNLQDLILADYGKALSYWRESWERNDGNVLNIETDEKIVLSTTH